MARLFFALKPSADVADAVLVAAEPLIARLGSWSVPAGNVHATLCFIGEVEDARIAALRAAAASVRSAPMVLRFDALEVWEKPRILCATVTERAHDERATPGGSPAQLAEALCEASIAAGLTPDVKEFRPHLTLARKIDLAKARAMTWPQNFPPGFVVRCEEFVLMESRRGEHGSIYSVVDSWPLYDAKGR